MICKTCLARAEGAPLLPLVLDLAAQLVEQQAHACARTTAVRALVARGILREEPRLQIGQRPSNRIHVGAPFRVDSIVEWYR